VIEVGLNGGNSLELDGECLLDVCDVGFDASDAIRRVGFRPTVTGA